MLPARLAARCAERCPGMRGYHLVVASVIAAGPGDGGLQREVPRRSDVGELDRRRVGERAGSPSELIAPHTSKRAMQALPSRREGKRIALAPWS